MKKVELFYDFVCPYAYLAFLEIDAIERENGAVVELRPILLGGVFRAIGGPDDPNLAKGPAKARYGEIDLQRMARERGVTLRRPAHHPRRTVLALRAALATTDLAAASRALFDAYWRDGRDLEDGTVVQAVLDAAGLDGAAALARANDEVIKADLRERTDDAVKKGVFGVPSFLVSTAKGEELFWGVDRRPHVAAALQQPVTIPFYFDYSSPFAYLASTQVRGLAARTNVTLDYRPILLGGLFKALGTPNVPLFEMPEAKRVYVGQDLQRWADRWGVPFRFTSRFPMNTVKALRLTLAADARQRPALVEALFRALWVDDRDIADLSELQRIAGSVGADDAVARIDSAPIKQALFDATDEARARNVFGVPTFFFGEEIFWGQDRLENLEGALLARARATKNA